MNYLPSLTFRASSFVGSTHQIGGLTGCERLIVLFIAASKVDAYCTCKLTNFCVMATMSNCEKIMKTKFE